MQVLVAGRRELVGDKTCQLQMNIRKESYRGNV